ncbi:MAG: DUF3187 family protein [Gammaproteobacteria bacterium]
MSSLMVAVLLPAPFAGAQQTEPYRSTNLAPPVAIFGLPIWAEVPPAPVLGLTTEVANHYRLSQRGDDLLILDGETLRLRAYYERPFARHWSVSVDVPFVRQSGGFLDNVIDAWHSAFNLPDGGRNYRPENELEYVLYDESGTFLALDDSGSGLGDVQLGLARRFGSRENFVVRASVKLPTGDEKLLAGSGSRDYSLTLLKQRDGMLLDRRAGYYWGLGLVDPGQPTHVRYPVEDIVWSGILGGALNLTRRFGIKAQITPLYDTELVELGETAIQATAGGWFGFGDGFLLEFAIGEDLNVSTAPDVALYFNLRWDFE